MIGKSRIAKSGKWALSRKTSIWWNRRENSSQPRRVRMMLKRSFPHIKIICFAIRKGITPQNWTPGSKRLLQPRWRENASVSGIATLNNLGNHRSGLHIYPGINTALCDLTLYSLQPIPMERSWPTLLTRTAYIATKTARACLVCR